MMEGNFIAEATIIGAFKTEEDFDDQNEAEVFITKNHFGKLYLICGWISLPCDLILYACCVNNTVTVHLKDSNFPLKKIMFDLPSIQEVDDFVSKLKLPQNKRHWRSPMMYQILKICNIFSIFFCSYVHYYIY
jgi:hypothetical protein